MKTCGIADFSYVPHSEKMPCLLRGTDGCSDVVFIIFKGLTGEFLAVEPVGKVFGRFQALGSFSLNNSRVLGAFQTSGCVVGTPTVCWAHFEGIRAHVSCLQHQLDGPLTAASWGGILIHP